MKIKTVLIVTAIFVISLIGYALISSKIDADEKAMRLGGSSERPGLEQGEANSTPVDSLERKDDE